MANRTPTSETDQTQPLAARPPTGDEADPTPAGIPGRGDGPETTTAAERPALGGSGAAGSGRPRDHLGRFLPADSLPPRVELRRIHLPAVPVSVALEHALIDRDADLFLAAQHHRTRMACTVLDAIRFGVEADRLEDAMAMYAGMLVRLPSDDGGRSS